MKILGIKKFTSKDGKKCCMVFVEDDFSMFDKGNAEICVGKRLMLFGFRRLSLIR